MRQSRYAFLQIHRRFAITKTAQVILRHNEQRRQKKSKKGQSPAVERNFSYPERSNARNAALEFHFHSNASQAPTRAHRDSKLRSGKKTKTTHTNTPALMVSRKIEKIRSMRASKLRCSHWRSTRRGTAMRSIPKPNKHENPRRKTGKPTLTPRRSGSV